MLRSTLSFILPRATKILLCNRNLSYNKGLLYNRGRVFTHNIMNSHILVATPITFRRNVLKYKQEDDYDDDEEEDLEAVKKVPLDIPIRDYTGPNPLTIFRLLREQEKHGQIVREYNELRKNRIVDRMEIKFAIKIQNFVLQAYTHLIFGQVLAKDAIKLWKEMDELGAKDILTYQHAIKIYILLNRIGDADNLLSQLKSEELIPNLTLLCYLIEAHSVRHNVQRVNELIAEIDKLELKKETRYYNALITFYGHNGMLKELEETVATMRTNQIIFTSKTFLALFSALKTNTGNPYAKSLLQNTIAFLDSTNKQLDPNKFTWQSPAKKQIVGITK